MRFLLFDFQCRVASHVAIIFASLVDDTCWSKGIAIAHVRIVKNYAVRPKMIAASDFGMAKHNRIGRKKIEIVDCRIMGKIDGAVQVVPIANDSVAIHCSAALENIPFADNRAGRNVRPGMNEIHEGRATRLECGEDIPAQSGVSHANDKKLVRADHMRIRRAQMQMLQLLEIAGIALPVQKAGKAVICGKARRRHAFHNIAQHPVTFARRPGIADDYNLWHVSSVPRPAHNSAR